MIHWLFSLLAGTLSGTVAAMGLGGGFVLFLYLTLFTDWISSNAKSSTCCSSSPAPYWRCGGTVKKSC